MKLCCAGKSWDALTGIAKATTVILFAALLPEHCASTETRIQPCLLKCKDNHMREMESEWSQNFAFPLLTLLEETKNETAAYIRANEICRSNRLLYDCLQQCETSKERTLMTMGLEPWHDLCSKLPALKEQFPCWRSNVELLTKACQPQSNSLRSLLLQLAADYSFAALQNICVILEELSSCAVNHYNLYCGAQSAKFIQRSYDINRATISGMLKMKLTKLPEACQVVAPVSDTLSCGPSWSLTDIVYVLHLYILYIFV